MSDPAFKVAKQIEAARILREQIADIAAGDPDFIRDIIEGETDLHESIAALVASISEDEALAAGTKKLEGDLAERRKRMEARADTKRALVASAMDIGELRKIETPAGTVSLKPVPPKLVTTDEAAIPTRFWKQPDPVLDLKALTDELKDRQKAIEYAAGLEDPEERKNAIAVAEALSPPIPGAELSNGSITISIRSK